MFEEIASADDLRLVLGGVGDPLLHPRLFEMVDEAHRAGIGAIALETDLLGVEPAVIDQLADSPLDVISVNFPAALAPTYQAIMGVDGFKSAMENLARLISRRQSNGRGTPLVIPTFVKTAGNLAEMEAWYDHWVRMLGCAVISGPSDFAGEISDVSIAQNGAAPAKGMRAPGAAAHRLVRRTNRLVRAGHYGPAEFWAHRRKLDPKRLDRRP